MDPLVDRRAFLGGLAASIGLAGRAESDEPILGPDPEGPRTTFQVACMTLPYSGFSFDRALKGIKGAGYSYVAWGTTHVEAGGERRPILAVEDPPTRARDLAARCRDLGLEPVLMFSSVYVEAPDGLQVHRRRIEQAAAAGIGQLLTFGHTEGGKRPTWIENLKQLGPTARDAGVTLVIKQHGGETGTGKSCQAIVDEVDHPNVRVNYDAGNVMDYLNVDPLPDIQSCARSVASLCIKDHRNWPKDEDCGPGFGEIDHYRLLAAVARTGRTIPLAVENLFAPLVPRPSTPDGIDQLAALARLYLEQVTLGLEHTT